MKQFLKKNWILITIMLIINAVIISMALIKVNYDLTSPAHITPVESFIVIDNANEQKGSFNTTSVYSYEGCNYLQYLLAHLSKAVIIEEIEPTQTVSQNNPRNYRSGVFQKNISLENSLICAYKAAGCELSYTYDGIIIHTLANYAPLELNVGDVISKVNGVSFNNEQEFLQLYNNARLSDEFFDRETLTCNLPLTINGEDKIITTNYVSYDQLGNPYPVYGFYYYECNTIDKDSSNPKYEIKDIRTTGPSGGLLQTLAVFNALTEFDYTYGLKIAGTGTIETDGTVGSIGGMRSKIFTAYYSGVKIFFVPYVESTSPSTNYNEAMQAYRDLGSPKDFTIVPVTNFMDAVEFLKGYGENHA